MIEYKIMQQDCKECVATLMSNTAHGSRKQTNNYDKFAVNNEIKVPGKPTGN